jgi:hypothetical protein
MSPPLKKKGSPKASPGPKIPKHGIQEGMEKPNFPAPVQGSSDQWVILLLLVAALFLFARTNAPIWVRIFLGGALVFQTVRIFRASRVRLPQVGLPPALADKIKLRIKAPVFLTLLLAAFSILLLSLPSFNWIAPISQKIPLNLSYWALPVLWLGLVIYFRRFPVTVAGPDFSSKTARILLLVILALGAFMRLYQGVTPAGYYGEDPAAEIQSERHLVDLNDFRNGFVFQAIGAHEPFFAYFSIFLWKLLPSMTSLMDQRMTGVLIDLAVIWILYLIGKELGGRRTGIWIAAMGALSKPLILKSLQGMYVMSLSLGVAVALLFFLRLVRKPTLYRFLQWGGALSLGIYTFSPFRPLVPFFIFVAFAWVWYREEKKETFEGPARLLMGVTAGLFLLYFLYANNIISRVGWIFFYNDLVIYGLPVLLLVVYFLLALYVLSKTQAHEKEDLWKGWLAGSWLCIILTFPILMNELIQNRLTDLAFSGNGVLLRDFLLRALGQAGIALRILFLGGNDRLDMFIPNDTFFGYSEIVLIALGMALWVARPTWEKTVLVLTAMAGISMYPFMRDPHTGWLIGCIIPLLALGGLGLEGFWAEFSGMFKNGTYSKWGYAFLIGFLVWTAQEDLNRVYHQWYFKYVSRNRLTELQAQKENKGIPAFLTPSLNGSWIGSVLFEGHPIRLLNPSNSLFLGPDDKIPGVNVYLDPGETSIKTQLQGDYPTSRWTDIRSAKESGENIVVAYQCFIPLSDISVYGEKYPGLQKKYERLLKRHTLYPQTPLPLAPIASLFEIRPVASPYWHRSYSSGRYGLGFGILDGEDKVVNANDPLPVGVIPDGEAIQLDSMIRVGKEGKYEVTVKAEGLTKVWVDGKKIFDIPFYYGKKFNDEFFIEPSKTVKKTIALEATDHRVRILTCFQKSIRIPDIVVHLKGSAEPEKSLWSSFNF